MQDPGLYLKGQGHNLRSKVKRWDILLLGAFVTYCDPILVYYLFFRTETHMICVKKKLCSQKQKFQLDLSKDREVLHRPLF